MAENITFRGCWIRYFDGRQEEGGAFVRIHLTAEFTGPVMDEMGWEDPGHSVSSANLDGEVLATHLILTPGDKQLKTHEIQCDISSISDFKMVSVEKDEMKRRELRFVARSSAPGVAAMVDEYVRRIGEHQGALKVSYVKQGDLPLEDKAAASQSNGQPERDTGCISCNNSLAFMDETRQKHVNGVVCLAQGGSQVAEAPPAKRQPRRQTAAEVQ